MEPSSLAPLLSLLPALAPAQGAPAAVFVDDDFDAATPGWQVTHFDALQPGIHAVATGGTVTVFAGTYAEAVTVDRPMFLVGQGPGVPEVDAGGAADTLELAAEGIAVLGLCVRNSGTSGFASVAVRRASCAVAANAITGAGLLFGEGAHSGFAVANVVQGGTTGIHLFRADGVLVENNAVQGHATVGISLFESHGCEVRSNQVVTSGGYGGITLNASDDATVASNTVEGHTKDVSALDAARVLLTGNTLPGRGYSTVELFSSPDATLAGNHLGAGSFSALSVMWSDRCTADGNQVASSPSGLGIYLIGSAEATMLSNVFASGGFMFDTYTGPGAAGHTFAGNTSAGRPIYYYRDVVGPLSVPDDAAQVILSRCTGVTIDGLHADGQGCAVLLHESDGNTVTNSLIVNGGFDGIQVQESSFNLIEKNVLSNNTIAIDMDDATGNTLAGTVFASDFGGLWMNNCGDNTIRENTFAAATTALSLSECHPLPNRVVHNAFAVGALHDACATTWQIDAVQGGNTYFDYAGQDLDGDGVGETPHPIAGGSSADAYPLVEPFGGGVVWGDAHVAQWSAGVSLPLHLFAGTGNAGRPYLLVAGASGTAPGTLLPSGAVLPLNVDAVTLLVLANPGPPAFAGFARTLDAGGAAAAKLVLPALPGLPELEIALAYALVDAFDDPSQPMALLFVP